MYSSPKKKRLYIFISMVLKSTFSTARALKYSCNTLKLLIYSCSSFVFHLTRFDRAPIDPRKKLM
jgi:hypothetical protein